MPGDGAFWDLVREHAEADGGADGSSSRAEGGAWSGARRDASVRLLDAAVGVVGSTRELLAVMEDVLREHRDRIAAGEPCAAGASSAHEETAGRQHIELSY